MPARHLTKIEDMLAISTNKPRTMPFWHTFTSPLSGAMQAMAPEGIDPRLLVELFLLYVFAELLNRYGALLLATLNHWFTSSLNTLTHWTFLLLNTLGPWITACRDSFVAQWEAFYDSITAHWPEVRAWFVVDYRTLELFCSLLTYHAYLAIVEWPVWGEPIVLGFITGLWIALSSRITFSGASIAAKWTALRGFIAARWIAFRGWVASGRGSTVAKWAAFGSLTAATCTAFCYWTTVSGASIAARCSILYGFFLAHWTVFAFCGCATFFGGWIVAKRTAIGDTIIFSATSSRDFISAKGTAFHHWVALWIASSRNHIAASSRATGDRIIFWATSSRDFIAAKVRSFCDWVVANCAVIYAFIVAKRNACTRWATQAWIYIKNIGRPTPPGPVRRASDSTPVRRPTSPGPDSRSPAPPGAGRPSLPLGPSGTADEPIDRIVPEAPTATTPTAATPPRDAAPRPVPATPGLNTRPADGTAVRRWWQPTRTDLIILLLVLVTLALAAALVYVQFTKTLEYAPIQLTWGMAFGDLFYFRLVGIWLQRRISPLLMVLDFIFLAVCIFFPFSWNEFGMSAFSMGINISGCMALYLNSSALFVLIYLRM